MITDGAKTSDGVDGDCTSKQYLNSLPNKMQVSQAQTYTMKTSSDYDAAFANNSMQTID